MLALSPSDGGWYWSRSGVLYALSRGLEFFSIWPIGRNKFSFVPNPAFLAKNELPSRRRKAIKIKALLKPDESYDALCPVNAVRQYLAATADYRPDSLFFNPRTRHPCTRARISQLIRRLVKISQPDIYCRAHDLRSYACAHAFYGLMSVPRIRSFGLWRTNHTFIRHYLPVRYRSMIRCVVLGSPRRAINPARISE